MPNIKSAKKRARKELKVRAQQASQKSALRTAIKSFEHAVANGETDSAQKLFNHATQSLDKAVSKGLIHKNTASRKKSRLAKKLNHPAS